MIRRVLGNEHPNTLTTMANLAALYRLQGKYAQAEPLLTSALAIGRRVQGEQHPNTLQTMKKFADLYRDGGKYTRGRGPVYQRPGGPASSARRGAPRHLSAQAMVGRVGLLQQKYRAAETTLRDLLKGYERAAPDTWDRYNCQSLLGASLAGQKKFARGRAADAFRI